ncbi:cell division protein FtsQ/DivIB [Leptospira idonii]|uniref:cell division protein FtsQ/DivIB n=1 Tax=Leptospira idonii TaxID=1193500 RepID=UPI001FE47C6D|nr:cell division protein [Leptospira idonii]
MPAALFVSGLIALVLIFHWAKTPKPVQKLVFEGLVVLKPADLMQFLDVNPEQFDPEKLEWKDWEKKLITHTRIRKVRVSRDREGFLVITLQEKVAEFVVHVGDMLYEIDEKRDIISQNQVLADNLIVISGNFPVSSHQILGTQIEDVTKEMRQTVSAYPALKTRISEVSLEQDGDIVVYLKSPFRAKVFLGDKLDLFRMRKLYASLAYLETENISASIIDLRGEDAVYH